MYAEMFDSDKNLIGYIIINPLASEETRRDLFRFQLQKSKPARVIRKGFDGQTLEEFIEFFSDF